MVNRFVELASVGNVPSNDVARTHIDGRNFKKLAKVVIASIRKVDAIAQDYFAAMATARSRKPVVQVSTLQCHY